MLVLLICWRGEVMGREGSAARERWIALHIYRVLHRAAHPREFREAHGDQMVDMFRAQLQEVGQQRRLRGLVALWWRTLCDLLESGLRTRIQALRSRRSGPGSQRWSRRQHQVLLHDLLQDIRITIRSVGKQSSFTVTVFLTIALGIGATTTVFSVVNAVVLRPLPFEEPGQLVRIWETPPQGGTYTTSEPTYLDWRERNHSFEELGAYTLSSINLTGDGEPRVLRSLVASHTLLPVLGIRPTLGRGFSAAEDQAGRDSRVVLLSYRFWMHNFAADPGIVGKTLALGGEPFTVIGITPITSVMLDDRDVVIPLAPDRNASRTNHYLTVVGRLSAGVSLADAQRDLATIARRLGETYPATNGGWGTRVASLNHWLVGPEVSRAVFLLFGAVSLLLLITCANISSLLIARGVTRRREIALRVALGAGRSRIVRQLLTESIILSSAGAVAGLLLTVWAMPAIRSLRSVDIPRLDEVSVDGSVLVFTISAAVLTGLVFGLTPALHAAGTKLNEALKDGLRAVSTGGRFRDIMVVAEIAVAVILLSGTGLMVHSFLRLQAVETGFDTAGVLSVRLQLPGSSTAEERSAFFMSVQERIAPLPGVRSVGAAHVEPFSGSSTSNRVAARDWDPQAPEDFIQIDWRTVTPGFFRTMGIPLRLGRLFDDHDRLSRSGEELLPTVVSETLAERLWPGVDPINKRLIWRELAGQEYVVVGVVGDIRDTQMEAEPPPMLYFLHSTRPWSSMTLLVKTIGDPSGVVAAIRNEIRKVRPDLPIPKVHFLRDNLVRAVAGPRFLSRIFALFAALALVLAATGVYGILMHQVLLRTREIGIRMAIGASVGNIVAMTLRESLTRALVGLAIGLVSAFALTHLMGSLLYETSPTDPVTHLVVITVLIGVAVLATVMPAARAARVNPIVACAAE